MKNIQKKINIIYFSLLINLCINGCTNEDFNRIKEKQKQKQEQQLRPNTIIERKVKTDFVNGKVVTKLFEPGWAEIKSERKFKQDFSLEQELVSNTLYHQPKFSVGIIVEDSEKSYFELHDKKSYMMFEENEIVVVEVNTVEDYTVDLKTKKSKLLSARTHFVSARKSGVSAEKQIK